MWPPSPGSGLSLSPQPRPQFKHVGRTALGSRRRRSPQPTYPRSLAAAVFPLLKLSTAEMV